MVKMVQLGFCSDSWFLESNGKYGAIGIFSDSWFLKSNGKNGAIGIFSDRSDSWFLESMVKMVQLGFSVIKNRASHVSKKTWFN
jgi:hypothetical protein